MLNGNMGHPPSRRTALTLSMQVVDPRQTQIEPNRTLGWLGIQNRVAENAMLDLAKPAWAEDHAAWNRLSATLVGALRLAKVLHKTPLHALAAAVHSLCCRRRPGFDYV